MSAEFVDPQTNLFVAYDWLIEHKLKPPRRPGVVFAERTANRATVPAIQDDAQGC